MDNRKIKFKEWDCRLIEKQYKNGRLALLLVDFVDGQPIAKPTVNVPNYFLEEDELVIKNYSENEGLLESLVLAGVVKDTGIVVSLEYQEGNVVKYIKE